MAAERYEDLHERVLPPEETASLGFVALNSTVQSEGASIEVASNEQTIEAMQDAPSSFDVAQTPRNARDANARRQYRETVAGKRMRQAFLEDVQGSHLAAEHFDAVVKHFEAPLQRFIHSIVDNAQVTEDLCQEVFLRTFHAVQTGKNIDISRTSAWLYTVAQHLAFDVLRRRRVITWVPFESESVGRNEEPVNPEVLPFLRQENSIEDHMQKIEIQGRIKYTLDRLPPRYRLCLLFADIEGYPIADIAKFLRVSEPAAKMRISRARGLFREYYQEGEGQADQTA